MQNLIKNKDLLYHMVVARKRSDLEEKIFEYGIKQKLETAISKKSATYIYDARDSSQPSYKLDERGITKYWKDTYENGEFVTRHRQVTRNEFLDWVRQQPYDVKQEIYHNLLPFKDKEISGVPGKKKSIQPQYLFGL